MTRGPNITENHLHSATLAATLRAMAIHQSAQIRRLIHSIREPFGSFSIYLELLERDGAEVGPLPVYADADLDVLPDQRITGQDRPRCADLPAEGVDQLNLVTVRAARPSSRIWN